MQQEQSFFPRRPPRLTTLFDRQSPFYLVTFNTFERRQLLASPELHETFVGFCRRASERGVAVGRYVLMPDHAHLFVVTSYDMKVNDWVRVLKTVLGKRLLKAGYDKPHWQNGFFDHLIRNSESYSQKWDYVRMNPVRAGLCEYPEAWPYQGEIAHLAY